MHRWIFNQVLKTSFHGISVWATEVRLTHIRFFWPEEKTLPKVSRRTEYRFPHVEILYRYGKFVNGVWEAYQEESALFVDNHPEQENKKVYTDICKLNSESDLVFRAFKSLVASDKMPKGHLVNTVLNPPTIVKKTLEG